MSRKLLIPLLTKGATNHLYRAEVIAALTAKGIDVVFLVREDYWDILNRFPECEYIRYAIPVVKGWTKYILNITGHIRYLYPSSDPWRKWRHRQQLAKVVLDGGKLFEMLSYFFAWFKHCVEILSCIEGWIYQRQNYHDLDDLNIDGVLVLGVGTSVDSLSSRITWWAINNKIPYINFIANYDGLCSKGFRGHPVEKILVWGKQMENDAIDLQSIDPKVVKAIGSLRYNMIPPSSTRNREKYYQNIGLNPDVKTIAFAGSAYEFHYFEMLSVFKKLQEHSKDKIQLILRVYPNQYLLNSAFMDFLLSYVEDIEGLWLSVGDPNYNRQETQQEVLQIEEDELWNILEFSDVVVNIFSTLTLEACIFNKPVINMWYFPHQARCFQQPVYFPYPLAKHIKRVMDSNAATLAENRSQLIVLIQEGINHPQRQAEQRKKLLQYECGMLDGYAPSRLAHYCEEMLVRK